MSHTKPKARNQIKKSRRNNLLNKKGFISPILDGHEFIKKIKCLIKGFETFEDISNPSSNINGLRISYGCV